MVQAQLIDYMKGCTIVTNPTQLKGHWTVIIPLVNLSGVSVVDLNLTDNSEDWRDEDFQKHNQIVGLFSTITAIGRVALYA